MTVEETDPSTRLRLARTAATHGNYEEALGHYRWLFDHSLQYDEGFYGVRLSYVLHEWRHLGDKYPRALEALQQLRDEVASKLRSLEASWDHFAELSSLNQYLDDEAFTHSAFVSLYRTNRPLALSCVNMALPVIVKQADASLAQELLVEIEPLALQAAGHLNDVQRYADDADTIEAMVSNAATDVHDVETVLRLVGRTSDATDLRAKAINAVESQKLRDLLTQQLAKRDAQNPAA